MGSHTIITCQKCKIVLRFLTENKFPFIHSFFFANLLSQLIESMEQRRSKSILFLRQLIGNFFKRKKSSHPFSPNSLTIKILDLYLMYKIKTKNHLNMKCDNFTIGYFAIFVIFSRNFKSRQFKILHTRQMQGTMQISLDSRIKKLRASIIEDAVRQYYLVKFAKIIVVIFGAFCFLRLFLCSFQAAGSKHYFF